MSFALAYPITARRGTPILTLTLLLFLANLSSLQGGSCAHAEVEFKSVSTNLWRTGYSSYTTNYDTYYAKQEISFYGLKQPASGPSATHSNYYHYWKSNGIVYTNYCPLYGGYGDPSGFEQWQMYDVEGVCHCEPGDCSGGNVDCWEDYGWIFWCSQAPCHSYYSGSSLPNGHTNYNVTTDAYKKVHYVTDLGVFGDPNTYEGTSTYIEQYWLSQPNHLSDFAATVLAGAQGRWGTGPIGSSSTVSWTSVSCSPYFNDKRGVAASLVKYRLKFQGRAGAKYRLSWSLAELYSSPSRTVAIGGQSRELDGTGTLTYTDWIEAPDPQFEESFSLAVTDISVEEIETDSDSPSGCNSGKCGSVSGGSTKPGQAKDALGSVSSTISLGAGGLDASAGSLSIHEALPSADLATPSVLKFNINSSVVTLTTNMDGSIDVAAPTMLARIVVSNSYSYWVHCSAKVGGAYQTSTPFVSHLFVNPNGSTNFNTLQRIEFRGGITITNEFVCETNSVTNVTWKFVSGNNLKGERLSKSYFTNDTRLETYSTFNPANQQEIYRRTRLYWELQYGERLLSETIDPNGFSLLTTNTYDSSGRLLTTLYPDGSWTRNEYDTNGVLLRTVRPLMNEAPTASTNDCRVTEFGYASVASSSDSQSYHPGEPRTVTELIQSQVVSRTMYSYPNTTTTYVRTSANPTTSWTDAANEATDTYEDSEHRVTRIDHADGTRTTISYSDSSAGRTTTTKTGVWNGSTVQPGTKTVQIIDPWGYPISNTTYDINSSGTEQITAREIHSETNIFGLPEKVTYLDGTSTTEVRQDCCQAAYSIDRDGVATTNTFDALNRLVSSVRLGVTNSITLDAASRPLVVKRSAAGSSIVQRGLVYDAAGRVVRETNALGGVTSYTNYLDNLTQSVKLVSFPDGGARTKVYFRDGSLNCVTNTAAFPVRYEYGRESDGGYYRAFTKEIKLNTNLTDSSEWTKTLADGIGRSYKTVFPGGSTPYRQSFYNNKGQLWKERDPDGVITLSTNNALGERVITATDSNRNDVIDFNGLDRITTTTNDVVTAHGTVVRRTRSFVVGTNNVTTSTLLSMTEVSTNGLEMWQTTYDGGNSIVSSSTTTIPTSGNGWTRTVTQTLPDNSTVVSVSQYGRLQSVTRKDSTGAQIGATTYAYDAHGRQYATYDARNGWTTFGFNNADQVVTITAPPIGTGAPSQVTTTFYDRKLRATGTLLPDGTTVTNEFYLNGLRKKAWGSRTYPVEYTYDYAGRMKTMKTWQNFAANSGTALTTWNYDSGRGWLANKRYADNYGPDYTYTDAGRLATRVWARSVGGNRLTTTYSYNHAGERSGVSYNDGTTPTVTYSYDRRGRSVQLVRNSITTALTYSEGGQLLREGYTGGTLDGLSITNIYDSLLRRTNVSVKNGTSVLAGTGYGYDNASRLATVTDGTNSATYTYVANSPLVGQIEFKNNGNTRMTTTKAYDKLNRLTSIANVPTADTTVSFAYDYNDANQRTRATHADGSYWHYEYDSLGQVTSGRKFWRDGTPVAGQQFDYTFDDIGNRKQTKAGGDQTGGGKRVASYSVNDLNQYTQRDVPGGFDVLGVARGTVTVNGNSTYRKSEYFRNEVSVNNGSVPQLQNVNVTSTDGSSVSETGAVFLAKTPEVFGYDLDGNMTNDGRWLLTWDGENRLTQMQSLANAPAGSSNRLAFTYDARGRRINKVTEIFVGGAWTITLSNRFVYDGWNLLAELNATNNSVINSFVWGLDLSGTMQGAGGVGGLLMLSILNSQPSTNFVGYDGNGNVAFQVSATSGTTTANYEYDPFGNVLRTSGPMALLNPFRFSTKYADGESGFNYYGYRFYNPVVGKWLSRDPIEELGGMNLNGMVGNNPVNEVDALGLASLDQLLKIMQKIHNALNRSAGCCPDEAAYLRCVLGELDAIFEKSGFAQVVDQALSQVNSWQVTVQNAAPGLDSVKADALEDALDTLAEYSGKYHWDGSGGIADNVNGKRKCFNKCISQVTDSVGTATEIYNGDLVVATMVLFEKASDAAVPLKPITQWISFYKDAYKSATKAIETIGLDKLGTALDNMENLLDSDDCQSINSTLTGNAPSGIGYKCRPKLNSGGAWK
jgi:RHS repeat-associated protein